MYLYLWRRLPGGTFLKIIQLLILASILIFVLFEWAFPYLAQILFTESSTVDQ